MIRDYVWIIAWLSLLTYCTTAVYSCTRCSDFNRENNPAHTCPSNPDQCGDCKVGFRKTYIPNDGSCEKLLPPVLQHQPPSYMYAYEGEVLNITCKFRPKDKVDCVWMRNDYHLEVSNRYRYSDETAHGVNTSDCSIIISVLKPNDFAEWQCGSLADSNSEGVMSEIIHIIRKERFKETPIDRTVELKDNITLRCTFDKEVDCVWLRRGFHLEISNRYAFTNEGQRGMITTDCSIRITNFTRGDEGTWQCGSMASSYKEGILSKEAILKINQTNPYLSTAANNCTRCFDFNRRNNPAHTCPSNTDQCGDCNVGFRKTYIPNDGSCEKILPPVLKYQPSSCVYAPEGDVVNLTCKFRSKDKVDCVWMRNGYHLEVSNRYRYSDETAHGVNTSDCSITISVLKPTDFAEWQCGSLADTNLGGVMSEPINITRKERFKETPTDRTVELKDNITLRCTFDKEVDCVWLRRAFHLEISNRYAFTNEGQRGMITTDCSIRITNFTRGDEGTWQCGSMASSCKEGILSKEAILKINQANPDSSTKKPTRTTKPSAADVKTTQHETTARLENTALTTSKSTQPSDPAMVSFIVIAVALGVVVITGVVVLLYWKLCCPIHNREEKALCGYGRVAREETFG